MSMVKNEYKKKPYFELGVLEAPLRKEFMRLAKDMQYSLENLFDFMVHWFKKEAESCYYQGKAVGETKNFSKGLLQRYMRHIMDIEGVSFIDISPPSGVNGLTDGDIAELEKIEREIIKDCN
jgi:hypothetical protein